MVVGERSETLQEKNRRHINEMEADIESWKNELEFARKNADKMYEEYCVMMIEICKNTITNLKEFDTQHFI